MQTAQVIQMVLLALLAGALLPVAVQAMVTLRATQRSVQQAEHRLDETMKAVESVAHRLERIDAPPAALSALGAALVPAAIAAVRAFRAEVVVSDSTPQKENHHERA
jgi:hypothetical protein